MQGLSAEDRRRLGLFLALMASDQDGEALAAARKVVGLLRKHNLRPEVLAAGGGPGPAASAGEVEFLRRALTVARAEVARLRAEVARKAEPAAEEEAPEPIADAAGFALRILDSGAVLTERERAFLADLVAKDWGDATPKQARWLHGIAARVFRRRRAG